MAINLAGADAYFAAGVHELSDVWLGVTDANARTAAVLGSRRRLVRLLGRALDETTTTETDFPREDAAAFEFALFILRAGFIASGDKTTPKWILGDPDCPDGVLSGASLGIPGEIRAWLFDSPAGSATVRLCRGL